MDELKVELSRDAALVLFEWLTRFHDTGESAFVAQAEQRALWDLQAALETQLDEPFATTYQRRLTAAQEALRDSAQ